MSGFGDSEPEDAFDGADPPAVRLENVIRRLRLALDDLGPILDLLRERADGS